MLVKQLSRFLCSPACYNNINKFIIKCLVSLLLIASLISICSAATEPNSLPQKNEVKNETTVPTDNPVFSQREEHEKKILSNPFAIAFYKPTYILPFYYTASPYEKVYQGTTPKNQKVMPTEFKAQFSFKVPLLHNFLGKDSSLNAAYSQLMYWQVYATSQYFRETDYQPELFITKKISKNFWVNLGAEHQSNGRGGDMERSWNRAYINVIFSKNNFNISLRPWVLIFQSESSNLHNKDIEDYMGHGEIVFSYAWRKAAISLITRNNFESGFKRGGNELDFSFPITTKVKGYMQFFSGFGQSLIEYNHYTNAFGIGIALSDWV